MYDEEISVVMCTYNGEKYVLSQLNSIRNQSLQPAEIIICDDCSTDETVNLVNEWIENEPFIECVFIKNSLNIGCTRNFENGIKRAKHRYIALSDQDDIWMPNKLELSMEHMKKAECIYPDKPIIVHTDLEVVNKDLEVIDESFIKHEGICIPKREEQCKALLVRNYITGCTILMNRNAANVSLPFPKNIVLHDWWIALVVSFVGYIIYIPVSTIMYRQHGKNVYGAKGIYSFQNMRKLFSLSDKYMQYTKVLAQIASLLEFKGEAIGEKKKIVKEIYGALLKGNIIQIIKKRIPYHGKLRKIYFYLLIVLFHIKYLSDSDE